MAKQSAGLLLFRTKEGLAEVFLVHPGGPFWQNKDEGAWSIPKGEFNPGEEPLGAAKREFQEETGFSANGEFLPLGSVRQSSGKIVYAWALALDVDAEAIKSNSFSMEWPRSSGRLTQFAEIDRASWFPIEIAQRKMLNGQLPFLARLQQTFLATPPNKKKR